MVAAALRRYVAAVVMFLAHSGIAFAYCGHGFPTVADEYHDSRFVFVGRVVSEEPTVASAQWLEGTTYSVRVEEPP
jgi:hypothetical protein